jgi:hypothetical protein
MGEQRDRHWQQQDARPRSRLRSAGLRLFGMLSGGLLRLLGATWRWRVLGPDPRRRGQAAGSEVHLAALFHESLLPSVYFFRDQGYSVAVSRSRDGDLIDATLRSLGYGEPARGSSTRGGSAALRGLLRSLEAGVTVAVLVDGPRGPARVSKTGIISLARRTGRPIQPVAFSARPALRLRSWDGSLIPLPFARVVCSFGEPVHIEADSGGDDLREQSAARELDRRLGGLHHASDHELL